MIIISYKLFFFVYNTPTRNQLKSICKQKINNQLQFPSKVYL